MKFHFMNNHKMNGFTGMDNMPRQKKPILICTLSTMLILAGSLVFFQFYFSYKELQSLSASCYDQGGFPIIEKSGTKIEYFHCDVE